MTTDRFGRKGIRVNRVFLEGLATGDDSFNPVRDTHLQALSKRLGMICLVLAFVFPPSFRIGVTSPLALDFKIPDSVHTGGLLMIPNDLRVEKITAVGRPLISIPRLKSVVAPVGLTETQPVLIRMLGRTMKAEELLGRLGLMPKVVSFSDISIPVTQDGPLSDNVVHNAPKSRVQEAFHKFEEKVNLGLENWPELREKAMAAAAKDPTPQVACWQSPVRLGTVSEFGEQRKLNKQDVYIHRGVDYKAPVNTQVRAMGPGTVLMIESFPEHMRTLVIHHGGGLVSKYSTLKDTLVSIGDKVAAGAVVGLAGANDRWESPHIHVEVDWAGHTVNPKEFLEFTQKICK